ncbi:MAG: FAD-binding oxidoreductase [Flavobacteriales bacterium]|nr:FAD-binding oxidoreductase [Flavobacteriales bacterium]
MNPSIWELETFYRKRDIIIIGAGFTGLWTAISIKEKHPEKSVLVLERSAIPIGASSRNAGFACFGSLTELIADSEKMGWQKTVELVKMRFDGLQKIKNYFKSETIDFELCGGYEILNDGSVLSQLDEVNERLKNITGIPETYFLSNSKIAEFGLGKTNTLIENTLEGSLHSGKLLQQLLQKCYDLKIEFLFGTEVLAINESSASVKLSTKNIELETDKLVIATNAFTKKLFPEIDLIPARGQILVTEPIPDLKLKGTFHYDEGFYYFRNLGSHVLLGGGRNQDFKNEETTEFSTSEFLQNHLEQFLKDVILPHQNFKIAHRWSGIMAVGNEKSPIIKKISERQIAAVRLSGMGVALAPKVGELVAYMI